MVKRVEVLPDTNVVLRYLLRDDPEQFAATEAFFEQVRTGVEWAVILEGVLIECLYVLMKRYQVSRSDAAAALSGLLTYKGVMNHDKAWLINGLNLFAATNLDPVDCLLLAKAQSDGMRVFSFDKALNKAGTEGRPA